MPSVVERTPNRYFPLLGSEAERLAKLGQSKLAQIREAIQHLEAHEHQIQQVVDMHVSNLAPANRLSDEILGMIFREVFDSEKERSTGQIGTLSEICKRWRDLIVGDSYFWSHISFGSYRTTSKSMEAHCRKIQLQLKRAGTRSLHIELGITPVALATLEDLTPMVDTTIRQIFENFNRCVSLILTEDRQPSFEPSPSAFAMCSRFETVFKDAQPELPLLQKLEVQHHFANQTPFWFPRLDFRNSPSLKELTISEVRFDFTPNLDWSILHTLQLQMAEFVPSHLLTALHAACNLERFEFTMMSAMREAEADLAQRSPFAVVLDKLSFSNIDFQGACDDSARHAASGVSDYRTFRRFIARVRAPNLQQLAVSVTSFTEDFIFTRQFLRSPRSDQCSGTLVYLALYIDDEYDMDANLDETVNLLAELPNLRQLLIGDVGESHAPVGGRNFCITSLLTALQWPTTVEDANGTPPSSQRRRLCPKLCELQLYDFPIRLDVLDAMIRSRMQDHLPVRSILPNGSNSEDAVSSDKPISPFKLFLVNVALSHPHQSQADYSRRECLQALRSTNKERGVDVSICGAHWVEFYSNKIGIYVIVPDCICSQLDDVDDKLWEEEEDDMGWDNDEHLDHDCDSCEVFDEVKSDDEWAGESEYGSD